MATTTIRMDDDLKVRPQARRTQIGQVTRHMGDVLEAIQILTHMGLHWHHDAAQNNHHCRA